MEKTVRNAYSLSSIASIFCNVMLCTIGVAYAAVRCLSVSLLVVKWWIWFIAHSDGFCLWQETDDQVPCISESCL